MEAGFGKADITPGPYGAGLDLRILGHWHTRAMPYGEVRDHLFARAAVLRSGPRMVCIVALDLIGDAIGLTAQVRKRIEEDLGLRAESVMVAFTHTHAVPETIALTGHSVAAGWTGEVAAQAAKAVREALENMHECALELAEERLAGVMVNRAARDHAKAAPRLTDDEWKRFSMLDETLRIAAFRGKNGGLVGTLFSFACHPVCVQAQGFISADWPGAALRRLEVEGPAMFLNGACGDADPVRLRNCDALEWTGGEVARKVEEILGKGMVPARAGDQTIAAARQVLRLRRRDVGSFEELEKQEHELEAAAANETSSGPLHERLFDLREKLALGRLPETLEAETQVIRIGALTLVGISGEVVACLAHDIRRALRATHTWVVGYSNGYVGYVVSELSFRMGAYEAAEGRWSPLARGEGERLRQLAIECAEKVASGGLA